MNLKVEPNFNLNIWVLWGHVAALQMKLSVATVTK